MTCIHPEDRAAFLASVQNAIEMNKPHNHKFRMLHPDGKVIWVHDKGEVIEFDEQNNPTRMLGAIHDITKEIEHKQQIEHMAFYDPLTGLPNRRLLSDRLKQSIECHHAKNCYGALLFLDLDHFKHLNDVYGHQMGDKLLLTVADRLQNNFKSEDTVARFGGDEFVVILNELSNDANIAALRATRIAEDLKGTISMPCHLQVEHAGIDTIEYQVTTSIGIVIYPTESQQPENIIQLADLALYKAKEAGRNSFICFEPLMQEQLDYSISVQKELKAAIANESLALFYQPKLDRELNVVGAEGLLRWPREDGKNIPTAEFIELAEESNLILPLGEWIFHQACKQLQDWSLRPEYAHLSLSVNISAKQIWQNDFVEIIRRILSNFSFQPNKLIIEITEGVMLKSLSETLDKLAVLKSLGLKVSLDDFGTGYSSLSYLKTLPVDEIKIDTSFVRDIVDDASDLTMVKAINDLGCNFALNVVAEGVETEQHLALLKEIGVPVYQGFLFSKALKIDEFEKYVIEQKGDC